MRPIYTETLTDSGRMLRQVSLEVNLENRFQDAGLRNGTKVRIVDCRMFNSKGMTLLMEVKGTPDAVRETVSAIRKIEGVRQAIEGEGSDEGLPLLIVTDRPSICKASSDAAIICLECPLNSGAQPASWRFIVRRTGDLRQIMTRLGREGIQTRIEEVSPMDQRPSLTSRQKEIIATAVTKGYFEFPRRISLTELSKVVGVKPSTLSEILRSGERRLLENAVGAPFFGPQNKNSFPI